VTRGEARVLMKCQQLLPALETLVSFRGLVYLPHNMPLVMPNCLSRELYKLSISGLIMAQLYTAGSQIDVVDISREIQFG
jgi:hypothetical protein